MRQLRLLYAVAMCLTLNCLGPAQAADDVALCQASNPFRDEQKTYDVCNRAIIASTKDDAEKASLLAQRGEAYYWVNHLLEAISDFDAALAIAPELNETRIQRGWARWRTGNPSGAYSDFTDAFERNPKSGRAVYALGFIERDQVKRRKLIEQAIVLTPDYYLAHDALSDMDGDSSDTRDVALDRIDFLLSQGQKKLNTVKFAYFFGQLGTKEYYDNILLKRGDVLYDLGRFDEALQVFRKLQKLYSKHPTPYMKEAEALLRLKDYTSAARVAETAYNICMENRYFDKCGTAISASMEADLHLAQFENIIKNKDEVENHRNNNRMRALMSLTVAQAYKSLGKTDEARAAFIRTGELDPRVLGLISDPMMHLGYYDGLWESKIDERFLNGLEACLLDVTCKANI